MQVHRSSAVCAAALFLFCTHAAADDAPKAPEPATVKLLKNDIEVAANGSSVSTLHAEIFASNDAAAMQVAQMNIPFDASMQTVDIVEAHTLKRDGTTVAVDASATYEQLLPGQPQVPMFTALRAKVIVFPQFAAGDTAVYTVKITTKHPFFEGQYAIGEVFSHAVAYGEVRETITAPKDFPLYVESHDVEFSKSEAGNNVVYAWHYSAPTPSANPVASVSPLDRLPRFFASSFKDYAELGSAYAGLAAAKIAVTPKIGVLADQITSSVSDRREQAKKIYEWVVGHIRYVGIELGKGSFVPHDVDSIVSNGYGDCKDHDALLQALLKAKGISAQSVLIDSGNAYTLTAVPTFFQLDHVITWLPEFKIYLDSSAVVAPFGVLPISEYGKPAVFASAKSAALGTTPVLPPGLATTTTTTVSRLDKDGTLAATTTTTATGPFAIALRNIGLQVQAAGPTKAASVILNVSGYANATGEITEDSPVELTPSYTITGKFTATGWSDEASGNSNFHIPGGMRLLGLTGDGIMGPFYPGELKDSDATACFSARDAETLSLQGPPGMKFSSVPDDVRVETPNLLFTAHWSLTGDTLAVHREFTSHIDQPLCTGEVRKQTAAALKKISESYDKTITFDRTAEDLDKAIKTNPNDADAFEERGIAHAHAGQNDLAVADYTQAIALNPADQAYFYNRGLAYSELHKYASAIEDFSKAIALKPDDADNFAQRGATYSTLQKYESAIEDFSKAIALKSDDAGTFAQRGAAYYALGQYASAIEDYSKATSLNPDDVDNWNERGRARRMAGQLDDALQDFNKATALKPDYPYPFYNRGMVYTQKGQYARAIKEFDQSIKLKPDYYFSYGDRANAYLAMHEFDRAIQDFDKAIALNPDAVDYLVRRGFAYISQRQLKRSIEDFDKAVAASPDNSSARVGRAMARTMLGQPELARDDNNWMVEFYGRVLMKTPDDVGAHLNRANAYLALGKNDLALKDANSVIALEPGSAAGYFTRANVKRAMGDNYGANVDTEKATKLDPKIVH